MRLCVQLVFQSTRTDFVDAIDFLEAHIRYHAVITECTVKFMEYIHGFVVLLSVMLISLR